MVGASLELSEVSLLKKFNPPAVFQAIQLPPPSRRSCASPQVVQHSHPSPGQPQAWVPGSGEAHACQGVRECHKAVTAGGMPSDGS